MGGNRWRTLKLLGISGLFTRVRKGLGGVQVPTGEIAIACTGKVCPREDVGKAQMVLATHPAKLAPSLTHSELRTLRLRKGKCQRQDQGWNCRAHPR